MSVSVYVLQLSPCLQRTSSNGSSSGSNDNSSCSTVGRGGAAATAAPAAAAPAAASSTRSIYAFDLCIQSFIIVSTVLHSVKLNVRIYIYIYTHIYIYIYTYIHKYMNIQHISPQGGTIGSWRLFIYRFRESMVVMLGASQNAQWLAAHTWHLLEPSFSIFQFVIPGVLKTISKMMLPAF